MKKKLSNLHFTLETRKTIEEALNEGLNITQISKLIKRDRSNIGREITKHRSLVLPNFFNNANPCIKRNECKNKKYDCFKNCNQFEASLCEKLTSAPHVCNACQSKRNCHHAKYYYKASEANLEYENILHSIRSHTHFNENEMNVLNTDFSVMLRNNKSVFHSLSALNENGYNFKKSTIYRLISNNKIDVNSSDLPRARTKTQCKSKDKTYKNRDLEGHTYEDYIDFKNVHSKFLEMQMDTVEGKKENNSPVILTLQIVQINFLLLFKIDSQTADKVIEKLIYFRNILTPQRFAKLFRILLTDNGKEFNPPERFCKCFKAINLFYCHPYASYEKGNIENNHELIRRVIPKGVSLIEYSQKDLNLLSSHINSLRRKSLNGKSPFDLVELFIPLSILKSIGLEKIELKDVNLTPQLLGNKNIENIKNCLDYSEIKKAHLKL